VFCVEALTLFFMRVIYIHRECFIPACDR